MLPVRNFRIKKGWKIRGALIDLEKERRDEMFFQFEEITPNEL
jgi:hypothetical protein